MALKVIDVLIEVFELDRCYSDVTQLMQCLNVWGKEFDTESELSPVCLSKYRKIQKIFNNKLFEWHENIALHQHIEHSLLQIKQLFDKYLENEENVIAFQPIEQHKSNKETLTTKTKKKWTKFGQCSNVPLGQIEKEYTNVCDYSITFLWNESFRTLDEMFPIKEWNWNQLWQYIYDDMIYSRNIKYYYHFIKYIMPKVISKPAQFPWDTYQLKMLCQTFIHETSNEETLFIVIELLQQTFASVTEYRFIYDHINAMIHTYAKNKHYLIICYLAYSFYGSLFRRATFYKSGIIEDKIMKSINKCQVIPQIMTELMVTTHSMKINCLLNFLVEIIMFQNPNSNKLLVNDSNKLLEEIKFLLKITFNMFATNSDGSMCINDMKRYLFAMGYTSQNGTWSVSLFRIKSDFERWGGNVQKMTFDGFCTFYEAGSISGWGRCAAVWTNLIFSGYHKQCENKIAYNVLMQSKLYSNVLQKLMNKNELSLNYLLVLPIPLCEFDDFEVLLLYTMKHRNKYHFMYCLMIIRSVCIINMDKEWMKRIMKKKYFQVLLRMMLQCHTVYTKCQQLHHLGMAILMKSMENICQYVEHTSNRIFMKPFCQRQQDCKNLLEIISSLKDTETNLLVQLCCFNARRQYNQSIIFLDEIPRKIIQFHSEILITGYLRANGLPSIIPDIIIILLRFF
eukprot:105053_1